MRRAAVASSVRRRPEPAGRVVGGDGLHEVVRVGEEGRGPAADHRLDRAPPSPPLLAHQQVRDGPLQPPEGVPGRVSRDARQVRPLPPPGQVIDLVNQGGPLDHVEMVQPRPHRGVVRPVGLRQGGRELRVAGFQQGGDAGVASQVEDRVQDRLHAVELGRVQSPKGLQWWGNVPLADRFPDGPEVGDAQSAEAILEQRGGTIRRTVDRENAPGTCRKSFRPSLARVR